MIEKLVSVVIPVYNREAFIGAAIQSILDQTYPFIELVIVDDFSQDNTVNIIKRFDNSNLKLIELSENKGVSFAFNLGVANSTGDYIARLDSDDIALPDRFERQINYLENNKNISICGTYLKSFESEKLYKFPSENKDIKTLLIERCPISIGTVMCRKEVFRTFSMNTKLRYSEDYEFWSRALFQFKAHNLPQVLVYYRQHDEQLTKNHYEEQIHIDLNIKIFLFKKLNYDVVRYPDDFIKKILHPEVKYKIEEIYRNLEWLNHLESKNRELKIFPHKFFKIKLKSWRSEVIYKVYFGRNPDISRKERIKLLLFLKFSEIKNILNRKAQKRF